MLHKIRVLAPFIVFIFAQIFSTAVYADHTYVEAGIAHVDSHVDREGNAQLVVAFENELCDTGTVEAILVLQVWPKYEITDIIPTCRLPYSERTVHEDDIAYLADIIIARLRDRVIPEDDAYAFTNMSRQQFWQDVFGMQNAALEELFERDRLFRSYISHCQ